MSKSNKVKSDFLGMPYGTACSKLRKMLLFKYVGKAEGGVYCWDCKEPIEDLSDFTIQHIKPWLYEDEEFFWDLENIAFSHKACNKPRVLYKKEGPPGTSWCGVCKKFLPVDEFWVDRSSDARNGLQPRCKTCKNNLQNSRRHDTGRLGNRVR